ncbi:multidrug effflux MFS transporter [Saccharibacillus sacchari]|uniref:multidrug effflux MFS transporter n=1 Tax=Saccharibacillus sacchari TaxID=456493 RepID=UPI0004BBA776|nr:multidrug effflux MFS transporter [Saccharibacillus sacchari]
MFLAILALLLAFASISTDLYLAVMPLMGQELSADSGMMEWTVSAYLLGFSLGQLFWGALSDRLGRRLPLAAGLLLFIIGSAGCGFSESVGQLIAWRVLQAVGASSGVVLARAMIRDRYDRTQAARVLSTLTAIMAIAPLLGPILGTQIANLASWRGIFGVLVLIGILTLTALPFYVPETLAPKLRTRSSGREIAMQYVRLLRNRKLLAYALALALISGGMFAYVAGSPFVYITYYGLPSAAYGLLFAAGAAGIMGMNMLNARLVGRYGADRLLRIGSVAAALFGVLAACVGLTEIGGLPLTAFVLFLFASTNGLIAANAISSALSGVKEYVGSASALLGCAQYGGGMIGSALLGAFSNGTPAPLGILVFASGLGCSAAVLWGRQTADLT